VTTLITAAKETGWYGEEWGTRVESDKIFLKYYIILYKLQRNKVLYKIQLHDQFWFQTPVTLVTQERYSRSRRYELGPG